MIHANVPKCEWTYRCRLRHASSQQRASRDRACRQDAIEANAVRSTEHLEHSTAQRCLLDIATSRSRKIASAVNVDLKPSFEIQALSTRKPNRFSSVNLLYMYRFKNTAGFATDRYSSSSPFFLGVRAHTGRKQPPRTGPAVLNLPARRSWVARGEQWGGLHGRASS